MTFSAAQPQPPAFDPQVAAAAAFPAVRLVLAEHDFHAFAGHPSAAELLRGRSAGVATCPEELIEAAAHQPEGLPLRFSSRADALGQLGLGLGISTVLLLLQFITRGRLPGSRTPSESDTVRHLRGWWPKAVMAGSLIPGALGIGAGFRALQRGDAPPRVQLSQTRRALEEELGGSLEELPVFFIGEQALSAEDRVLLTQLCGFHGMLRQRDCPIPAAEWRALSERALAALRAYRCHEDPGPAQLVGATISEWVSTAEQQADR